MSRKATKAAENTFYLARMEASSFNDNLNSREGAAEITGIDRTRLARIELGSLIPYPEEVLLMSDVYNSPELCNHFCSNECALGKQTIRQIEVADLDRLTLQVLSAFQRILPIKDALLEIAGDGVISSDERPKFNQILEVLNMISDSTQSLRLWAEKNLK